jgi:malate dehydrogenase
VRNKVTIVGAGMTGSTMCQLLAQKNFTDIVLIDIVDGLPQGKALDILQAGAWGRFSINITGTIEWKDTKDSDVVIITSGVPRKPGMTREDLLNTNASIVESVIVNAKEHSPNAKYIIFSNPMDAMCHVALNKSGLDSNQIIGQGGMLDSARYRTFLAEATGKSVVEVNAWVLGGHTEATMVPIVSNATIGGVQIENILDQQTITNVVDRASKGGAEIVGLLKTGSAFVAPAFATIEMVESIVLDQKRILPACALLNGQYGISDAFVGVPITLGKDGVETIHEFNLSKDELDNLQKAGNAVKELMQEIN